MHKTENEEPNFIQQKKNKLDAFVTKMPMPGQAPPVKRNDSDDPTFEINRSGSYVSDNQNQEMPTIIH
jgi:hypothetical protein